MVVGQCLPRVRLEVALRRPHSVARRQEQMPFAVEHHARAVVALRRAVRLRLEDLLDVVQASFSKRPRTTAVVPCVPSAFGFAKLR